ncbi:hypothetical protein C8F01DRAFT_1236552 [Mycena amicta]|nr:hypothetical protein C8F01DRAFT_1236552 [Mycena amicta]
MADVANFIASHPPALKVGGRRHSISNKQHRPHHPPQAASSTAAESESEPPSGQPAAVDDYPRPTAPSPDHAAHPHAPPPPHTDVEEDKKHLMEVALAQRKAEMARAVSNNSKNYTTKGFGAGGRIAQPMKEMHI